METRAYPYWVLLAMLLFGACGCGTWDIRVAMVPRPDDLRWQTDVTTLLNSLEARVQVLEKRPYHLEPDMPEVPDARPTP
jgi:hypothetical protein